LPHRNLGKLSENLGSSKRWWWQIKLNCWIKALVTCGNILVHTTRAYLLWTKLIFILLHVEIIDMLVRTKHLYCFCSFCFVPRWSEWNNRHVCVFSTCKEQNGKTWKSGTYRQFTTNTGSRYIWFERRNHATFGSFEVKVDRVLEQSNYRWNPNKRRRLTKHRFGIRIMISLCFAFVSPQQRGDGKQRRRMD
jgi:hypothetical protein